MGLGVRKIQGLITDRDSDPNFRPSGFRLVYVLERPTGIVFRVAEGVEAARDEPGDSFGVYNQAVAGLEG